jgi:cell division protein FtsA
MVKNDIIAVLDIGSTWVRAVICERGEDGNFIITGVGVKPSTGLRKGVVVNIEATLRAVRGAIEDAEMMSVVDVQDCWAGIGGNHISGLNSRGVVGVTGKKRGAREIGQEDIDRVIEAAKAVVIPMDKQILEVIPQSYIVDDQKGIRNPLDMIGVRLESEVHIITCTVTGAQNLVKCINRAGFKVNELILQTLAAGSAVLTREEIDLGVVLIDIGGGTTDVLVYADGSPYSTYTVPAGGAQVTSDISIIKNISVENAEKIKVESGCCWEEHLDGQEFVIVPGVGGRAPMSIPRAQILGIVKPRMTEIFKMVKQQLDVLNPPRMIGGGVVLTGGAAKLSGVAELAGDILKMPARLGTPIPTAELGGLVEEYRSVEYATVIGLAMESIKRSFGVETNWGTDSNFSEKKSHDLIEKFKTWLNKEFL